MIPATKTLKHAMAWCALGLVALLFFALSPSVAPHVYSMLGLLAVGMAVSANQVLQRQKGCRKKAPVAASTMIYGSTLVFTNASGYADDDTASGVNRFAGISVDQVDNSGGSNADKYVELETDGRFLLTGSGFAQTSVSKKVYATDNFTITLNAAAVGAVYIGHISEYVSSTQVWVKLDVVDDRQDGGSSIAATGSAQGDAAQLTFGINSVSGADGTKGVLLPPCSAGKVVVVYNEHATNGLKVYPASGDDINDGTADAAITIEGKLPARFTGLDSATWAAQFTANT